MVKKMILAGGTGFIGKYCAERFEQLGFDVRIISRQASHISWDDHAAIVEAIENSELLFNLAGRSVDCRYNENNKQEILRSRTETTAILGNALLQCRNPPPLWINSSTATIYRHAEDRPMTEENGEIGSGFSVEVANAWERTFFSYQLPGTRQIALRLAIVLGKNGGVMTPYRNLVRFGLGGVQGSGNQRFSWIHLEDLFEVIHFLKQKETLNGIFNCSSPNPVTNRELMSHFRKAMRIGIGLPTPKWMLKMGALLVGTETELILKSRWVVPERLEREGFKFKVAAIDEALHNILT